MIQKLIFALASLAVLLVFTGCLSSESKEYRFKINADGSGSGTITFVNLVSQEDDSSDVSLKDFGELVDDYLQGSKFEDQNPPYHVTGKRLYEKDGRLMGEVAFTFHALDSLGFFRQPKCDCCPVLLYAGAFDETYAASDGKYLGDTTATPFSNKNSITPFIVWPAGTKEFYVKTTVQGDMANTHSLLAQWQQWKSKDPGKDKDKD